MSVEQTTEKRFTLSKRIGDADSRLERLRIITGNLAAAERKELGAQSGNLICEQCGSNNARRNRQNTSYHGSDNMATLCPECQAEADDYWAERWDDYYSGCM